MKDRCTLLQEDFCSGDWPDPWKVLVLCQMLNRTTWMQVEKVAKKFFERWPSPSSVVHEEDEFFAWSRVELKPLGLAEIRARRIYRMSSDIDVDRKLFGDDWASYPVSLYAGCGVYATDAWFLFVLKRPCDPKDRRLRWYAG